LTDLTALTLKVSEVFDSLQGEGPSIGQPCSFLRLAGCNLHCVWCDTKYTWDWENYSYADNVTPQTIDALVERLSQAPRVVITGGEPLLQQAGLEALLARLPTAQVIEVETNGTRLPSPELFARVDQWNVSAKLASSGEPLERRILPEVLHAFRDTGRAFLKLVIADESGAAEAAALTAATQWPAAKVMYMPQATTREAVLDALPAVAAWSVAAGVAVSTRLHLLLWNGERAR
jgi:7-carboxy-7-deazaguanine synthase